MKAAGLLVACLSLLLLSGRAHAEALVLSLSNHRVQITSTWAGSDLVIFGVIDNDRRSVTRQEPYDVVVTAIGPRASTVVREKVRLGPIWMNLQQRKFFEVPITVAQISSRPIAAITAPDLRRRFGLGLEALLDPAGYDLIYDPSFRSALIRLQRNAGLYKTDERGVTFITPSIFRAIVPVPPTAPLGGYEVNVALYSGGVLLARESTNFEVSKAGFEQAVATAARQHPYLYGLATAAIALIFGWLATVIFRRD
ncbi:membrane protein [Alsobacter metallidurans]|uniref:Membrane protein n=1 Tax=Alsobacter metallidurans TaxID=340221 RepID=A0A917I4P9_9HYPH|nr:TIGR02186 family protein [Alsobacter metallidurans]GGH10320.1 membrane protein [Alsobacter metallidurans]